MAAEQNWKDNTYTESSRNGWLAAARMSMAPGKRMTGLQFEDLRVANLDRLPQFKNRKGQPAHSEPDGSDWALSAWSNATLGELGEAANLIKKIERGDTTLDEARSDLADEFADVVIYLDILAFHAGVSLGDAVVSKFNQVSKRVGATTRLANTPAPEVDLVVERAKEMCRLYYKSLFFNTTLNKNEIWDEETEPSRDGWLAVARMSMERGA